MTLVALWVRKVATLSELVVVSDSRVSAGETWDRCPKIVALPRPATGIAMSGDATTAYAFIIQAINACLLLDGNEAGRTDLRYLARKLRDVFTESRSGVTDLPAGHSRADVPTIDVVLFGWSWRRLQFEAYSYSYDAHGSLLMQPISQLDEREPYGVYFAGDAKKAAREALNRLLTVRKAPRPQRGHPDAAEQARAANLEWEPIEVLQQLIDDRAHRTVGGAPQLLKLYQYGATESFVWRNASGDHFGGRPIGPEERFDRRIATFADDGTLRLQHSDRSIATAVDAADGDAELPLLD